MFTQQPTPAGQVVVAAGERIILDCAAMGNPRPLLSWTLNGQPVSSNEALLSTTTVMDTYNIRSRLTIGPLELHVAGVYQCVAQGRAVDGQNITLTSNTTQLQFTCKLIAR